MTTDASEPSAVAASEAAPVTVRHPFHETLPDPSAVQGTRAAKNAALSPAACRAELRKRGVPFSEVRRAAPGVSIPVQLTGAVRNVRFLAPDGKSLFGILDCRLAVSLDDAAEIFERHGVVAVQVDSYYRKGSGKKTRARRKKSLHTNGLAMDMLQLDLADGRKLRVDRDWRGVRSEPACGEGARVTEPTAEAIALRNVVCEVARAGVFHRVLTPNFDAAHESHLHLDIERGAKRMSAR